MSDLLSKLNAVIPAPLPERCYKCWLSNDSLLLFALSQETRSYSTFKYEVSSATLFSQHPYSNHKPEAYLMHIRCYDRSGTQISYEEIFLPPRLALSPDRKYICWLETNEDWVIVNLQDDTFTRQARENPYIRSGQAVWLADSERWGEFIKSSSGKTYVRVESYSTQHDRAVPLAVRGRIRSGICIGTTPQNELIEVRNLAKRDREDDNEVEIHRIELNLPITRKARYKVALPRGYHKKEVKASPDGEHLVWLLGRQEGKAYQSSLWQSRVDGQNLVSLGTLDAEALSALAPNETDSSYHLYDLEWLPEGNAISFICGGSICSMTL